MSRSRNDNKLHISVFGGSSPKPEEKAYEDALNLGKMLGSDGYTVLTGGYIGTMEAVSRGAVLAGSHVIGVTCDEIETWRPVKPNPWVREERRFLTLRERIWALIDGCDAAVALPGGVGTLAEIALIWSQMQVQAIPIRPLILVGDGWQKVIGEFYTVFGNYIPEDSQTLVTVVPDVNNAVQQLKIK